ncbi:hypothetical protein BS78_05G075200 [Paspalum vaginatum]|nr:hypothetical protein BS78_05G075200 [Paspalum vaginatum]
MVCGQVQAKINFWVVRLVPLTVSNLILTLKGLQSGTWPGDFYVFECDALRSAIYLQATLLEALRLFPATPFEEKEAHVDDILPNGTRVAKAPGSSFHSMPWGE